LTAQQQAAARAAAAPLAVPADEDGEEAEGPGGGLNFPALNASVPPVAPRRPRPGDEARAFAAEHGVKRNDPCPCGSGQKFKKCCGRGAKDEAETSAELA